MVVFNVCLICPLLVKPSLMFKSISSYRFLANSMLVGICLICFVVSLLIGVDLYRLSSVTSDNLGILNLMFSSLVMSPMLVMPRSSESCDLL